MPGVEILDLPFAFRQNLYPYRSRTETFVNLRDYVPVSIRSFRDDEAPISIELTRHDVLHDYPDHFSKPPVQRYRLIDGELFQPLGEGRVAVADFQRDCRSADWRGLFGAPRPAWSSDGFPNVGRRPGKRRGPDDVNPLRLVYVHDHMNQERRPRATTSDREESRARAAEGLARALVIIDGEIWTSLEGREPHWEVDVSNGNTGKVTLGLSMGPDVLDYVMRFRLDRYEDARAFAEGLAAERGQEFRGHFVPDAMIYDDDAVRRDDVIDVATQILQVASRDARYGQGADLAQELAGIAKEGDDLTLVQAAAIIDVAINSRGVSDRLDLVLRRWEVCEVPRHEEIAELARSRGEDIEALGMRGV